MMSGKLQMPNRGQQIETLATMAMGALVLAFVFHLEVLFKVGLILLLIGLFVAPLAKWVTFGWLKLSSLLGFVNGKILLTLIFFGVLTPFALIYRVFNRDALRMKKPTESVFKTRNHTYSKEDFENAW